MRHRRRWTVVQVFWFFFSIITLTRGSDDDGLYQVDPEHLFQSLKLDLQTDSDVDNKYEPWSYRPFCTDVLKEINTKLCVYTSTTFAGGRGLSLFTTPHVAGRMAATMSSNLLDDPLGVKVDVNSDTGKWYTKPVPGKGVGMFANSPLNRGDLIVATTPILIAFSENILDRTTREEYLRRAVDQLPSSTRDMYLGLSSLSDDPATRFQDISAANTFGVTLAGRWDHLAVFPEASRMNHDCSPNSQFRIDNETLTQYVRAVRAVDGEELTIAYTSPLDNWTDRQEYLSRSFGFRCACARCRRGEDHDSMVLSEIYNLQSSLGSDWSSSSSSNVAQVERLIKSYQREGLEGYMDPVYCLAALTYSSVGSKRGVQKYVDLAIQAIELRLGPEHQDIAGWKEMSKHPENHWSWKRRKPR